MQKSYYIFFMGVFIYLFILLVSGFEMYFQIRRDININFELLYLDKH